MAELVAIVAPVFLIILLGFGLGKTRLFGSDHSAVLINFVWYVAIPFLLFRTLAPSPLPHVSELKIVLAYYLGLYIVYSLAYFVAKFLFRQTPEERPVFSFVVCFGNGAFLGIPLIGGAYGDEGIRFLLIILSFHTLTLLPISTFLIEKARGEALAGEKGIVRRTFDTVGKNPIILSLLAGTAWSALGLPFPFWLDRVTALPAGAAAPVGLFAAGLAMTGVHVAGDRIQALVMAAFKLLVMPLVVFLMSRFVFDLPPTWVGVATVTAALPSGMVGYSFASQYNVAPRRAASAILFSTTGAVLTLSVLLTLLGYGPA